MQSIHDVKSLNLTEGDGKSHLNLSKAINSPEMDFHEGIFIHKAITVKDISQAMKIRWKGYKKYYQNIHDIVDEYDLSLHTTVLLAEDEHGRALGTLRILDRRYGRIELDDFVDVDSFLHKAERSCIEATRLSIPRHPHPQSIKFLLWKALLLYCQINDIDTIIGSVRPAAARLYHRLHLENVGPSGVYNHPCLGNLEHHTYKCNISEKKYLFMERDWPLCHFFFIEDHPNINTDHFELSTNEAECFGNILPMKETSTVPDFMIGYGEDMLLHG